MNTSNNSASTLFFVTACWLLSLVVTGMIAYAYGKGSLTSQQTTKDAVLSSQVVQEEGLKDPQQDSTNSVSPAQSTDLPADSRQQTATTDSKACSKTGFAQKWEYLTPYTVKQNDTLESVATEQLKDASRVNELLKLNGVGPYVVGSTLYLPPSNITKSSGNLKQVYGKLIERNNTSWHISFTPDKNGQGILIQSFLFNSVPNKDEIHIGDCVSVLLDDGYKIYTLALQ